MLAAVVAPLHVSERFHCKVWFVAAVRSAHDLGALVRVARRRLGWSQTALAEEVGTTRQWIGLVEGGHPRAELTMVLRTLAALRLGLSAAPTSADASAARTWLSAADAAEAIREELARGDEDFALRMLARAVADFRSLDDPDALAELLREPPSTGDLRWDTLLAATVSRECRRRGMAAPAWTAVPALDTWWFPAPDPLLDARTIQRTPIDLSIKGIWLDANALETL